MSESLPSKLRRLSLLAALVVLSLDLASAAAGQPPVPKTDLFGDPLPPGAIARFGTVRWRTGARCVALAYMPDGKSLLSVDADNGCCVWDVATGKKLRQFGSIPPEDDYPWWNGNPAAISADRRLVATVQWARGLEIWEVASGKRLWVADEIKLVRGIDAMVFSPDGKSLAARGPNSADVDFYDATTGLVLRHLPGPNQAVRPFMTDELWRFAEHGLEFSPDGKILASAPQRSKMCIHDLASGKQEPVESTAGYKGDWLVFSTDNKWLAWREGEGDAIYLMDRGGKAKLLATGQGGSRFACLSFSPDGKTLACLDSNEDLHCWNLTTEAKTLHKLPEPASFRRDKYAVMTFSPDGETLAMSRGPVIYFYDIRTGKKRTAEHGHSAWIKSGGVSRDGKSLVSCGWDGTTCVWDAATGKLLEKSAKGEPDCYNPDLAREGSPFVDLTGKGIDQVVALWKPGQVKPIWQIKAPGWRNPVYDPPGKNLAFSWQQDSWDGAMFWIVEALTGRERRSFRGPMGLFVNELNFSPDGRTIATRSSWDGLMRLWDVATGREMCRWQHAGAETCFFSRDGKHIVTGSTDTTLLLWDIATLTKSFKPAPPPNLSAGDLDKLWNDLGSANAEFAFDAVCTLTAAPDTALPLIAKRFQPVPTVDPKQLQQWLDDLDSDIYAVRQKATKALEGAGERAEPALRAALKTGNTLEKRQRIQLMLQKIEQNPLSTAELRGLRALEILEVIGTGEALRVAESVVTGPPESVLALERAITVRRIKARLGDLR